MLRDNLMLHLRQNRGAAADSQDREQGKGVNERGNAVHDAASPVVSACVTAARLA
jgi:hypothetical protein